MLPHLLFSQIDAYIGILSRAVIGTVPVLRDPLRGIANLRGAQLKKGGFLEKRAERQGGEQCDRPSAFAG